jgi:hypothetical protein
MNKKNTIRTIIIVALLLVIGSVWFVLNSRKQVATPPLPTIQTNSSIEYINNQYGFRFSLPQEWKGYSIISGTWKGNTVSKNGQVNVDVLQGPMISIRSPLWSYQTPRQDIPIMIFTTKQWVDLQQDKFHIGAAPINPSQLGSSTEYVYALPARYNYAYTTGWEEVEQILKGSPLQPLSTNSSSSVHIDSVIPSSGSIGSNVIINGFGFTASNTVLFDKLVGAQNVQVVATTNGHQSISFSVPSALTADCKQTQPCPMFARQVTPGNYSITVKNQNGTSSAISFTVVSQTINQRCGGNTTNPPQCSTGYKCVPDPKSNLPFGDVGGICVVATTDSIKVGQKEFNFLVQKINQNSVDGLWYVEYPVATSNGTAKTLYIGDSVGYACTGKTATLTSVDVTNKTVTFNKSIVTPPLGGCPI